ncbi:hypothetical protein GCM10010334_03080 [Streptomyces finlayi]|uniref:Uncharacterized protein n=1 Tax=Streptomyces finlayi TaxID=67296 RepID=A0A918WSD4_9ACTN|nr:hypothetical protein GCM10010334_03080 [Streptomyces finlayi]
MPGGPGPAEKSANEKMSARELYDAADRAMQDLGTARMTMRLRTGESGRSVQSDVVMDWSGENCRMTHVAVDGDGSRYTQETVRKGEDVWIKADAGSWAKALGPELGRSAEETARGRYVHGTVSQERFREAVDSCGLAHFMGNSEEPPDRLVKGPATLRKGEHMIPLRATSTAEGDSDDDVEALLYVAAEGTPWVRETTTSADDLSFSVEVTDYNAPFRNLPPAPSATVDSSALASSAA